MQFLYQNIIWIFLHRLLDCLCAFLVNRGVVYASEFSRPIGLLRTLDRSDGLFSTSRGLCTQFTLGSAIWMCCNNCNISNDLCEHKKKWLNPLNGFLQSGQTYPWWNRRQLRENRMHARPLSPNLMKSQETGKVMFMRVSLIILLMTHFSLILIKYRNKNANPNNWKI
jgi:hypothetical protein